MISGKFIMINLKQSGKSGYLGLDFAEVGSEPILIDRLDVAGKVTMSLAKQSERALISMTGGALANGASLSIVGRTLTPVTDPTVSLVFPDVDLRQWTVGAGATVKTTSLRPEGNVQWEPARLDPTAEVTID